ncbi:SH3 domain-containing protein [Candidatus Parcubacteria bacterium]|nr:SH3 domain-containing protein [Candidatus Parcubacteria bacterium]
MDQTKAHLPGTVTAPAAPEAPKPHVDADSILKQPEVSYQAPKINLLGHEEPEPAPPPPVQPAAATPRPSVAAPPRHRTHWPVLALAAIVLLLAGGAGYFVLGRNQAAKPVAQTPAETTPIPAAEPPAAPEPKAAPPAAPPAAVAPSTVTAPATTPTADNPQTVTVTNKSGLWLRSTPDSSNRSNIIGWIPNGGQVSVDHTGDFWWHGTYQGKAGYFASKYTN